MHNGVVQFFAGAEDIKDSTLHRTASPTSQAFNESRPGLLMSSALPIRLDVATFSSSNSVH